MQRGNTPLVKRLHHDTEAFWEALDKVTAEYTALRAQDRNGHRTASQNERVHEAVADLIEIGTYYDYTALLLEERQRVRSIMRAATA